MTSYQANDAPAPAPSPTRLGRYELLGKLATGGMGEIHLARVGGDGGFEKVVVVKRLLPELVASADFVAMFLDEARIAARLSHPNVCEVHELGRDGNDYYIGMQYLEGVAFTDLIATPREPDRARELRVVAGLAVQACEGLHAAHELRGADGEPLGLVHRDVSPSNLMVTTAGVVKILDFGIAKVRGATARTALGTIKGKYAYMSPEQVRGDELDRRSDLFSLGVVLYELATHQRLFKRGSDFLAAKAILEETYPRADEIDPAVPRALADVIAKALARERDDRHATARELGAAIAAAVPPLSPGELAERVAADHAIELSAQRTRQQQVIDAHRAATARGDAIVTTAPTVAMRNPRASAPPSPPPPRSRSTIALVAGAVIALSAAVIAIVIATHDRSPDPAPSTTISPPISAQPAPPPSPGPAAPPRPEPSPTPRTGSDRKTEDGRRTTISGYLSIDSSPYAIIYLDGRRLGETPLLHRSVPSGRHKLRAVTEHDGERVITIDVPAGGAAPPINLTW
ncbi:MAG TPA: serine/threonine-protein kinase [Kofleriaceae bacterium]|nr:serine/threonine-protein kinase [Kofleriaceae bacterium]